MLLNNPNHRYVFWPDLASSHYAKKTIDFLSGNSVNYVSKLDNPLAVPMLRPIETFFSHLKAKVYSDGWKANNENALIKRVKNKLKLFDKPYFCRIMKNVSKVAYSVENGTMAKIKNTNV